MSTEVTTRSLAYRRSPLAAPDEQLRVLESTASIPPFGERLTGLGLPGLAAAGIEVLQINLGKLCNQTCRHCHVDAGPDRREMMSRATLEQCLAALARNDIPAVDITGGAPELHPAFRWLVEACRRLGRHVMDRCNLSVLLTREQEDLVGFLASHRVEVVASLPCYTEEMTDAQRGAGVFERSIEALHRLNERGYGREGTGLELHLVTNPAGTDLPAEQTVLESDFRRELAGRHGIVFNRLYTLTNMPISRFLDALIESGHYDGYMERLHGAFNPAAVAELMCRTTLSVSWDGRLYDCDFNQMLELPLHSGAPAHINEFDLGRLTRRRIATGRHCYGCAAGAGSSCGGALT